MTLDAFRGPGQAGRRQGRRRPRTAAQIQVEPPASARGRRLSPSRLFEPVDIASLVLFRVAFGAIMLWEVWRYFNYGWIGRYYVVPSFHFTYFGFEWVRPWPAAGMYLHFYALGALAVCIMLGCFYRLAATLFFFAFSYVFLLEQARYLNHLYLVCLVSLLAIFVPAHHAWSVDAWRRPELRSDTAPAWSLWLLRVQIGIPYFYGGLAKLNADWLAGEPLRSWFVPLAGRPLVGPLFAQEWAVYLFSYGGLLLDLLVVPLLLWRRTRVPAFAAAVGFHLLNAWMFQIGIFPWFMIVATLLFFPPDLPRRLWARARRRLGWSAAPAQQAPGSRPAAPTTRVRLRPAERLTVGLLGVWLVAQLLIPLRHHLYPGDVAWTEEGHRFSWRMKLRDKDSTAEFFATVPATGAGWQVDPRAYVTRWQYEEMSSRPDMILQLGHHIAAELRRQGYGDVVVRAQVVASLNGRPPQPLIDPTVDLAAQPRTLAASPWITPLGEPQVAGPESGRGAQLDVQPVRPVDPR